MKWFLPSWNGDLRLEQDGDDTLVVIIDPTAGEKQVLAKLGQRAKKRGWHPTGDMLAESTIPAGHPYRDAKEVRHARLNERLEKVAPTFIRMIKGGKQTINAVVLEDGKVVTHTGTDADLTEFVEATAREKPKAGVSAKRPTPSCPQCYVDAVEPATDVLLSFLDEAQHEQWRDSRTLVARGGTTGHRYLLAHRHTPLAARLGRICYDLDDQLVVHFHDMSVPPEEEVLASKLILEHSESWLRNEATIFGPGRDNLKNPFGNFFDGVPDAGFTKQIGVFVEGFVLSLAGDDQALAKALERELDGLPWMGS